MSERREESVGGTSHRKNRGPVNNMKGLLESDNWLKVDFNNGVVAYVREEGGQLRMLSTSGSKGRHKHEWKPVEESYLYGVAQSSADVGAVTPEEVDFDVE